MARTNGRRPKKLTKRDLIEGMSMFDKDPEGRVMHLDLVGTAEAAEQILHVERARIGKWRRNGILLSSGERIEFPEPISMATTSAKHDDGSADHGKLAATPLWWADDIRDLAKIIARNKPRD
jgi:hypothetical protein